MPIQQTGRTIYCQGFPFPEGDGLTIGQKYDPIVKLAKTPDKAKAYLEGLILFHEHTYNQSREEAEEIQYSNVGYYAGYMDEQTRHEIYQAFGVAHPIFGRI
jgi:hypothetical protein